MTFYSKNNAHTNIVLLIEWTDCALGPNNRFNGNKNHPETFQCFKVKKVEIFKLFKALLCKVYYLVMSQIVPYICEQLGGIQLNCIVDDGEPWFRAIDVATALKYTRTDQAIRMHVADDDKREQGSFVWNPLVCGV